MSVAVLVESGLRNARFAFNESGVAAMINGVHAMLFADDAEMARAFLRDVLGLEHVDAGHGWLIFAMPPAELGVHPVEAGEQPHHRLYLMCDDLNQTVEDLKRKGVEFSMPVRDEGWGIITAFRIPGAGELALYQPRHPSPLSLK